MQAHQLVGLNRRRPKWNLYYETCHEDAT